MSTSNSATNLYYCIRNAEDREFRNTSTPMCSRPRPWREPIDALERSRINRAIAQQREAQRRLHEDRIERALEHRDIQICNHAYRIRENFRQNRDALRTQCRDLQALLDTAKETSDKARATYDSIGESLVKVQREDNAKLCQDMYWRGWHAWVQSQVEVLKIRQALHRTRRLYAYAEKTFEEADLLLVASWSEDPEGVLVGTVRRSD